MFAFRSIVFYNLIRKTDMTKRNTFNTLAITILAILGFTVLMPQVALADCAGVETSIIDCNGTGENAIFDIIKMVIRVMTISIGVVAVGAVIMGALLYGTSGDNPENVKKAKGIWMNVVIGLALFAFLVTITNFLIPGGVF